MQATRAEGLARLAAFTPKMGKAYANGRNYDLGAGAHKSVSQLSPYIRRRLIHEREAVAAALAAHGAVKAEKFIQEVIWRSYFKGWLEMRPMIWRSYVSGLDADLTRLDADRPLARAYGRAVEGQTGLACFDAWARELVETGYLHNHARMWFASIWIFTLGLPWRLGADFFYRHLLDGDAASNTLGWRWVAGLHTRGKFYAAEAWNIAKFTQNRFAPRDADLAVVTEGLEMSEPDGLPPPLPLRGALAPRTGAKTLLVITDEDCGFTPDDLAGLEVMAVVGLTQSHLRHASPQVALFEANAIRDCAARLGRTVEMVEARDPKILAQLATRMGAAQIATPYIPQGPLFDWITLARAPLAAANIPFTEWRDPWDARVWPHATAGFFKVKQKIPQLIADMI
ncbi:deoxyribodipyrimidine photolyase [Rhodobacteraceae bacterium XHP0102]|nr:deoxyribodipyrimidine photolyase [Rhodobacteraceae bacterium XHP0102]